MTTTRQLGFAYGQVGKALQSRVDQNFYALGLKQLRNAFVERAGVASSRAGTIFTGDTIDSTYKTRLIPFVFSPDPDQAYALAFSNLTMRVVRNGELVTEAAKAITAATKANPCQLTVVGHGWSTGDHVIVARGSVFGMRQLNGREYIVTKIDNDHVTLKDVFNVNVNSTGFGTYLSGGSAARVYQIATPFVEADLSRLYYDQAADVVALVHRSYFPRELVRTGHAAWTLSQAVIGASIARPGMTAAGALTADQFVSGGAPAGAGIQYVCTAVKSDTKEESGAGIGGDLSARGITNITQANPAVVTVVAGNIWENGDAVWIGGVGGMTQINDKFYKVANYNSGANTFELEGIDSTGYSAYTAGGTARALYSYRSAVFPTPASPEVLQIPVEDTDDIVEVRVYRRVAGAAYGYLGSTRNFTQGIGFRTYRFSDSGTDPDVGIQPPLEINPFETAGSYPGVVATIQQRRFYGSSTDLPHVFRGSRVGSLGNFNQSFPQDDGDPIIAPISSSQVTEIKHLVDMQRMVILTAGSEAIANGDSAGTLTPSSVNIRTSSYNGSSNVRPVLVDNTIVFVQERGALVFGMAFNALDRYDTYDLSLPSVDLLEGHTIVDMAYQKAPNSVVWLVRDDGKLLSFTYVPQQEIKGWAIHDVGGLVESICAIPEADQTAIYMVVKRDLPGQAGRRTIERLAPRLVTDLPEFVGCDNSRTYDGRHRSDGVNVRIEGGTTWEAGEPMQVRASGGTPFHADDVGGSVFVYGSEDVHGVNIKIRCTITGYVSATVVNVVTNYDVPAGLRTVYTSNWDLAALKIYELWHLEGMDLALLQDGGVFASPNNADVETVATVASGSITLSEPGGIVTAGLPFMPTLETLNIDSVQGEPLIDKKKLVKTVDVFVKDTRGVWAGPNPPADDEVDPLEGLEEATPADVDDTVDEAPPLISDVIRIRLQSRWNSNGRVFLRQVDPLPMTILAIAPSGVIPLRG